MPTLARVVALAAGLALLASGAAYGRANEAIGGIVTDEAGQPIKGAVVTLTGAPKDPVLRVTTNKKGKFFFGIVRSAYDYQLSFEYQDFVVARFVARALDDERRPAGEATAGMSLDEPLPTIRIPVSGEVDVEVVLAPRAHVVDATLGARLAPIVEQLDAGDYQSAIEAIDTLLEEAPDNAKVLYLKGFALLRSGDADAAVAWLQRAVGAGGGELVGVSSTLGAALAESGRFEEAEQAYLREAEGGGDLSVRVNSLIGAADAALARGNAEASLAALEKAIELDSSRPEVYSRQAEAYSQLGDQARAEEIMARAESMGGGDPTALFNLAARYMNEGEYEKAASNFRKAVALDPSLKLCHYHLGIALLNLERLDEAREELELFVREGPEGAELDTAQAVLESLK